MLLISHSAPLAADKTVIYVCRGSLYAVRLSALSQQRVNLLLVFFFLFLLVTGSKSWLFPLSLKKLNLDKRTLIPSTDSIVNFFVVCLLSHKTTQVTLPPCYGLIFQQRSNGGSYDQTLVLTCFF